MKAGLSASRHATVRSAACLVVALAIAALLVLLARSRAAERLADAASDARHAAPVAAAAAAATLIATWIALLVPSTPVELFVAYSYEPPVAFAIVYAGKVAGCLASFYLGRTCCGRSAAAVVRRHSILRAMSRAARRQPLRLALLARAAYIPIAIKNVGASVIDAPPREWALALVTVEAYNSLEFVAVGYAAQQATQEASSSPWRLVTIVVAALALVVGGAYAAVLTHRELATLEHEPDEESLGLEERQVLGA